jgi:hypothetical protein
MNERIQELVKKAVEAVDIVTGNEALDNELAKMYIPNCFAEKFAELIVRECVKFCEHESNDDEHDEYDMGMWVKAESIKTAIMEEFGVEE